MNSRHPGNYQVRLPSFLAPRPELWADELGWVTPASNRGAERWHPASGRVIAAAIAKLDTMRRAERLAFLNDGFRLIQEREITLNVPGRQRMRAFNRDSV